RHAFNQPQLGGARSNGQQEGGQYPVRHLGGGVVEKRGSAENVEIARAFTGIRLGRATIHPLFVPRSRTLLTTDLLTPLWKRTASAVRKRPSYEPGFSPGLNESSMGTFNLLRASVANGRPNAEPP